MKTLFICCALFLSSLVSATSLNKIVVFGDSLSDNGNLYEYMKHQLPISPPYYEGRFTNGPVWVELVASAYYPTDANAHLLDYAFGGAGVLEDEDGDDGLFTLRREMDSYFLAHQDKGDADSLYIVWIGSNNYLGVPDDVAKTLYDVNLGLQHALQRLVDHGAKHVLVVNLPDLGKIPAARDFDAVDILSYFTKEHNAILSKNIQELENNYPSVQWMYLDVNVMMQDMMTNPQNYGFTNIMDTCYEQMGNDGSPKSVLKIVASIKPKARKDACTGYLFFDPVHPSFVAHQFMAEKAKAILAEAGIEFH